MFCIGHNQRHLNEPLFHIPIAPPLELRRRKNEEKETEIRQIVDWRIDECHKINRYDV